MAPPARLARPGRRLRVVVTDALGRPIRGSGLDRWLSGAAPRSVSGTLGLALVSDAAMRRLNRRYRGRDAVTDVLAFPAGPAPARRAGRLGPAGGYLGEVVIARGRAVRQARRLGHSTRVEHRVLALHGLLHLLGYDHVTDDGAMRRAEERLRRRAGLPTALTARASGWTRARR